MLDIRPMAGALGAEIHGLELSSELAHADVLRIRELLNQYQVIFFHDQALSPAGLRALAHAFGPLQSAPGQPSVDGFPEIGVLESSAEARAGVGPWQSDMSFREHPPMATLLRAEIVPARVAIPSGQA